jgi:hypothetical protein
VERGGGAHLQALALFAVSVVLLALRAPLLSCAQHHREYTLAVRQRALCGVGHNARCSRGSRDIRHLLFIKYKQSGANALEDTYSLPLSPCPPPAPPFAGRNKLAYMGLFQRCAGRSKACAVLQTFLRTRDVIESCGAYHITI